jgi:hypothetical protein
MAGGCRRNRVERTNTMDLTTDRVIQEPDAGVISDSMKAHPISTILDWAAQETYWWKRLFNVVGFELDHDIHVSCDNKRTVDSIKKEDIELKTKIKHVDIYNHWLRQEAQSGRIDIKSANGLTKLPIVLSSMIRFCPIRNIMISKIYILNLKDVKLEKGCSHITIMPCNSICSSVTISCKTVATH